MTVDPICRFLEWDSEFFQRKIAIVHPHKLTEKTSREIAEWSGQQKIDCLYFLADIDDPETIRIAEENGFHFVDVRVTLQRKLEDLPPAEGFLPGVNVRLSSPEDIPALKAIAAVSHQDTRFYFDTNFPRALCDGLYRAWIERSCCGYADVVFVATIDDEPQGYTSCHLMDQETGHIGLVAVAPTAQGKGLGKKLIFETARWCAQKGRTRLTVVTQGRNANAQRLYQKCGFTTSQVHAWYHKWWRKGPSTN